jgi:hypothetical protein
MALAFGRSSRPRASALGVCTMADTYGVTPEDVGNELISLFPDGFAVSTKPTVDQVAGFITDADAVVTLHVSRAMGETDLLTAATVRLARRYIIDAVKAQVMRILYADERPARRRRGRGAVRDLGHGHARSHRRRAGEDSPSGRAAVEQRAVRDHPEHAGVVSHAHHVPAPVRVRWRGGDRPRGQRDRGADQRSVTLMAGRRPGLPDDRAAGIRHRGAEHARRPGPSSRRARSVSDSCSATARPTRS